MSLPQAKPRNVAGSLDATIAELDALIRAGKAGQVRPRLQLMADERIPRENAADLAQLCWRAHLPLLGVRILNPIVRPPPRRSVEADDIERAEYAHCLARAGGGYEAMTILEALDSKTLPRVLFYQTTVLFGRWEYAKALPLLERYVRSVPPKSYEHVVGRVNYAAALVYEKQYWKAAGLLSDLLHETSVRGLHLLRSNVFQLSALNFIGRRAWNEGERFLAQARKGLKESEALDEFLVRKWEAILKALNGTGRKSSVAPLVKIREEAQVRQHWETVRECDRIHALAVKDPQEVLRLYFGTPFPGYRNRLLEDFGLSLSVPETFVWNLGPGVKPRLILDLQEGKAGKGKEGLKVGSTAHRLLTLLSSDFYRPFRLIEIYSQVFPGEFYNPTSSPWRVYQSIKALRRWLSEAGLPLDVAVSDGEYRLKGRGSCGIRVFRSGVPIKKEALLLTQLSQKLGLSEFSVDQVSRALDISPRTALRLLTHGIAEGNVERIGKRAFTRYRFLRGR